MKFAVKSPFGLVNPLVGEVIVTGEDNGLTARIYPEQAVDKRAFVWYIMRVLSLLL